MRAQANGAGKSTLIKMLTGETQPNEGSVWKHPNTRVAYVAQHAFHHLEQVLQRASALSRFAALSAAAPFYRVALSETLKTLQGGALRKP